MKQSRLIKSRAGGIEQVAQSSHLKPPDVPDHVHRQQWDGVMSCGTWRQLCLCRLWDVWSVARVRPLAAMSRFIGFNKAECANNCHRRRGAKPPRMETPPPHMARAPARHLPPRRSPLCPWPACCSAGVCWCVCKSPGRRCAGRLVGPGASPLILFTVSRAQILSNSFGELSWRATGGAREHPNSAWHEVQL